MFNEINLILCNGINLNKNNLVFQIEYVFYLHKL